MSDQKRRELNVSILEEWHLSNKKFDWMDDADCKGMTHLFFPDKGDADGLAAFAKEICRTCKVKDDCLQFALDNTFTEGIWGGMGPRQRKDYKSKLRKKTRGLM